MNEIQSYSYKPKFQSAVFAIGIFLAAAVFMSYETAYEDRGVIIDSLIELGPQAAKGLFMLLALMSFGLVGYGVMVARASLMRDRNIGIAWQHVSIPDSILTRTAIEIPFADITGLSLKTGRNFRILHIHHKAGATTATERFFESRSSFEDFLARLQIAVQNAHIGQPAAEADPL